MPTSRRTLYCLLPMELGYAREILLGVAAYEPKSLKWSMVPGNVQGVKELLKREPDVLMITMAPVDTPIGPEQVVVCVSDNWARGLPRVISDNEQAGRMAAEYLFNLGYTHFAYWGDAHIYSDKRAKGFEQYLSEHDHQTIMPDKKSIGLKEFLSHLPLPCAVYTSTDRVAQRLMETARGLGYGVPLDLAILGTNNDNCLCECTTPKLSSLDLNGFQVGLRAAQMVEEQLADPGVREILIPPTGVVHRGSTSKRVSQDVFVNRALMYVQEHALEGITVEEVSNAIGCSVKTLQKKFRQDFGESLKNEIRRVQYERAKELLRDTNLPILDVALACGFTHSGRFSGEFTRRVGTSPAKYRKGQVS